MSTSKDIASIVNLFSESSASITFEAISSLIQKQFNKPEHFKLGTTILAIMQNNGEILKRYHYLTAYYILFDLYKSENISHHPFLYALLCALKSDEVKDDSFKLPSLNNPERHFLLSVIASKSREGHQIKPPELSKKTAQQIVNSENIEMNKEELDFICVLETHFKDRKNEIPSEIRSAIPCILEDEETRWIPYEPILNASKVDDSSPSSSSSSANFPSKEEQFRSLLENMVLGDSAPIRQSLSPEFIRIAPPLHSSGVLEELIWLDGDPALHHLQWDARDSHENNKNQAVRLLEQAALSKLPESQTQLFSAILTEHADLIGQIGMTPSKLPDLIQFSPHVATMILLQLSDSADFKKYLDQLCDLELSLHSMEVVNQLAQSISLPDSFVADYINNCIVSCEKCSDKSLQSRHIRLVCVFIGSLMRLKLIHVNKSAISHTIQSFCLAFSKYKEAAAIWKQIKNIKPTDTSTS